MPSRPPTHNPRPAGAKRDNRPSAAARGYDRAWQRYRAGYLREHPLCVKCADEGRVVPATVVDHMVPHKGDEALFWDPENHQPMCKRHHDRKTACKDGGFGNECIKMNVL